MDDKKELLSTTIQTATQSDLLIADLVDIIESRRQTAYRQVNSSAIVMGTHKRHFTA